MTDCTVNDLVELPCSRILEYLEKGSITLSTYRVWLKLRDMVSRASDKIANISYRNLAASISVSMKTVMRAVSSLCQLKLLHKRLVKTDGCYFEANLYSLPDELLTNTCHNAETASNSTVTPAYHVVQSCQAVSDSQDNGEQLSGVAASAVQEINDEIARLRAIHDRAVKDYAQAQTAITQNPGQFIYLQNLGNAETLRDQALREIEYLQIDLAKMGEAAATKNEEARLHNAVLNPRFFHELKGDRPLTEAQYKQLVSMLGNFKQDTSVAINSMIFMIRFGTLARDKSGLENPIDRSIGIGMKLIREERYQPMSESYLYEKIKEIMS